MRFRPIIAGLAVLIAAERGRRGTPAPATTRLSLSLNQG